MLVAVVAFVMGLMGGGVIAIVCICLCLGNKHNGFENDDEYYEWAENERKKERVMEIDKINKSKEKRWTCCSV